MSEPMPEITSEPTAETPSRNRRPQLLVGFLCALVGFALVIQVRGSAVNPFANLRQEDLVRLLEDVTVRGAQLTEEVARLEATRLELATSGDQLQAALEIARERAAVEGILSGRLPAQGPGLEIAITDPGESLTSAVFVNLLEELRNAGAEAVQIDRFRVTTSSSFINEPQGVYLDGNLLPRDVTWLVIGDPTTMSRALEIPGGALPQIRVAGGETEMEELELVEITATAVLRAPMYAQAVTQD